MKVLKEDKNLNFGAGEQYNKLLNTIDFIARRILNRKSNESPVGILDRYNFTTDDDHIYFKDINEGDHKYTLVFDFTDYNESFGEDPVKHYVLMDDKIPHGYTVTKIYIDTEDEEDRRAEDDFNKYEAEFGADGIRAFGPYLDRFNNKKEEGLGVKGALFGPVGMLAKESKEEEEDEDQKELNELLDNMQVQTSPLVTIGDISASTGDWTFGAKAGSNTTSEELEEDLEEYNIEQLTEDITKAVKEGLDYLVYDDDFFNDYVFIDVNDTAKFSNGDPAVKIDIRWELSYEEGTEIIDRYLNPVVKAYDNDSYFEHETETEIIAYLRKDKSDDIVNEDDFNKWMTKFKTTKNMDEFKSVWRELTDSADHDKMTFATFDKLLNEVVDPLFKSFEEKK